MARSNKEVIDLYQSLGGDLSLVPPVYSMAAVAATAQALGVTKANVRLHIQRFRRPGAVRRNSRQDVVAFYHELGGNLETAGRQDSAIVKEVGRRMGIAVPTVRDHLRESGAVLVKRTKREDVIALYQRLGGRIEDARSKPTAVYEVARHFNLTINGVHTHLCNARQAKLASPEFRAERTRQAEQEKLLAEHQEAEQQKAQHRLSEQQMLEKQRLAEQLKIEQRQLEERRVARQLELVAHQKVRQQRTRDEEAEKRAAAQKLRQERWDELTQQVGGLTDRQQDEHRQIERQIKLQIVQEELSQLRAPVECHGCGYDVEGKPPSQCPKCGSFHWSRTDEPVPVTWELY